MRTLSLVMIIASLLIFPLATNAQDVTGLINEYERCKNPDTCKKIELTVIKQFLSKKKIPSDVETLIKDEELSYEITQGNLSGKESREYIFMIVLFGRSGYIVVLKRDIQNKKFMTLPIIEQGFIYDVQAKDVTGDGIEELMFRGYGTGTGYWEEWLAVYKYKDNKMNLIWSGDEKEVTAIGDKKTTVNSRIYFYNVPGYKSKEIHQTEITTTIDAKTEKKLSEKIIGKRFKWSLHDFKFIEAKEKE